MNNRIITTLFFLSFVQLLVAQKTNLFVAAIEKTYGQKTFQSKKIVRFDLEYELNGIVLLRARISARTNSSAIRLDRNDGTTLIFDGKNVWQSPDSVVFENARFNIFAWHYFFAIPFKMHDVGAKWQLEKQKTKLFESQNLPAARLTFEKNVGDSPDDYFLVFKNPNHSIAGMAYHVSAFLSATDQAARAITYDDFTTVEGVLFAQTWQFWRFDALRGAHTRVGSAKITNVKFIEETQNLFKKPKSGLKI